jgi:bifunctional non-homologous end joining protein LigD
VHDYAQVRQFCEILCRVVHERLPEITSMTRAVRAREQCTVYLDYLQHVRGKTIASVYSVRPRPLAPVSTPLRWDELEQQQGVLRPERFTIETVFERLESVGDLWAAALAPAQRLGPALDRLRELLQR